MKITIVGPRSVGKSTVSKILAEKLNYKYISSDDLMNDKMKEHGGLDLAIKSDKIDEIMLEGFGVVSEALKINNLILDLAGGSISSKNGFKLGVCQKITDLIKDESLVVGLLPLKDSKESIKFLLKRECEREHFKEMDLEELEMRVKKDYFKIEPILKGICSRIFYVEMKSPETIALEILESREFKDF